MAVNPTQAVRQADSEQQARAMRQTDEQATRAQDARDAQRARQAQQVQETQDNEAAEQARKEAERQQATVNAQNQTVGTKVNTTA